MAVYVDPLFAHWRTNREGDEWCHMIADTREELHAFAKLIGRKRCWYEKGHYDLTPSFRKLAVENGAIELTRREFAEKLASLRKKPKRNDN